MDLNALGPAESAVLELVHPVTGVVLLGADKKPITITLAGRDSEVYRQFVRASEARAIEDARLAQRRKAEPSGDQVVDQADAYAVSLLVACTLAWSSNLEVDGKALECNAANAAKLYTDPRTRWTREQAHRFVNDRAGFFPSSKPTS